MVKRMFITYGYASFLLSCTLIDYFCELVAHWSALMARLAHHSRNYGGARPNSGPKKGSVHRMTERALEIVAESDIHPLEYLLSVMTDESQPTKLRTDAATSCLPYCLSRLSSTEISITNEMDNLSDDEIKLRLEAVSSQLLEFIPKGKLINGSAERVEEKSAAG